MEEFPSLPPHTSSLMAAMQQALEGGEEGLVERVRERMREVCGDRNTSNIMFFGHLRAGQVAQAYKIMEVHTVSLCLLLEQQLEILRFVCVFKNITKNFKVSTGYAIVYYDTVWFY